MDLNKSERGKYRGKYILKPLLSSPGKGREEFQHEFMSVRNSGGVSTVRGKFMGFFGGKYNDNELNRKTNPLLSDESRHCEEDLSPTKQSSHFCHSELVSESIKKQTLNHITASPTDTGSHKNFQILNKTLNQVQGDRDKCNFFAPCNHRGNNNCKELIHSSTYQLIHFKKSAFTLAEVLITIGTIGVVAALTIPGLINNYKANRLRTQFLKSYSTIQQVFKRMEDDNISFDLTSYDGKSKEGHFYKVFMNYLQAPIDCGASGLYNSKKYLPCYDYQNSQPYKTLDGKLNFSGIFFDNGQIALQDGSLIMFEQREDTSMVWIHVDLNGYNNLPNRLGYDVFTFQLLDGELHTMGDKGTYYNNLEVYCSPSNINDTTKNGIACAHNAKNNPNYFKWVIKNVK
ncbi:type II secretion system protein [bacterium]|nr:type II secretion system protein [bacterium]